jgi:hypothetical protein
MQMRRIFLQTLSIVLFDPSALSLAHATNYDLAADWSDTNNPNGVWSYKATPNELLTNHFDDWDPSHGVFESTQPAWAFATWPNFGHIPHFYKVISAPAPSSQNDDEPIGRIVVHNNDPANSPSEWAEHPAVITWTAPTAGYLSIVAGIWEVQRYLQRLEDWTLKLNGVAISGGVLTFGSQYNSSTPLNLTSGWGGASALNQAVAAGDVLSLDFQRHVGESLGTNIGMDWTVFFDSDVPPIPGDYNSDGRLDTDDYVVWRKTYSTPLGFEAWRANFGRAVGESAVLSNYVAVPEPTASATILAGIWLTFFRRRIR